MDLNNINHFSIFVGNYFFSPFYTRVHHLSKEYRIVVVMAPVVGLADGVASAVQAIGAVAEAGIKGFGNLLKAGALRSSEPLKRGCLQLTLGVGIITIMSIPIICSRVVRITWGMFIDPKSTSWKEAEKYRLEPWETAQAAHQI